MILVHSGRPVLQMARGDPSGQYDREKLCESAFAALGVAAWGPGRHHHGQRSSIYVRTVERVE